MALGSELFTLSTSFDPYGAYREGGMKAQKYDIEQQKLDVQQQAMKEAQAEMAPKAQAGAPLAGMAKSMLPPGFQLDSADGVPTSSGLLNQQIINSQQDLTASQQMMKQATMARAMGDDKSYANLVSEARRLQTTATQNLTNAKKEYQKSIDDGIESLYGANSQVEYDQRLKDALTRTGIPLPKGFPETWSPDLKPKLLSMMSPETRNKVEKEERARRDDARKERSAEIRDTKILAALQANADGFGKDYKDVKGQVKGLTKYLPVDVVKGIGAKEIPAVASRIESSKLTAELAESVAKHPKSAGLAASFAKTFDKYLPERYDASTEAPEALTSKLNAAIDNWTPKGATPDEISEARSIAKKAVDVINARALAASGGSRMLVAEVKMQKDVIGLEGLSPKSAVKVYEDLAESDLRSLEKFGIERDQIKGFNKKPVEKPAETKPSETKPSDNKSQAMTAFGSYEPEKYEYGINPKTGKFARRPKGQ